MTQHDPLFQRLCAARRLKSTQQQECRNCFEKWMAISLGYLSGKSGIFLAVAKNEANFFALLHISQLLSPT
jgi:hypothetical protein